MKEYYDEDYFMHGLETGKSAYGNPYEWKYEGTRAVMQAMNILHFNPRKVLDVGCGRGFVVKALFLNGVDAHGCDISKWAIENAEMEVRDRLKLMDIRKPMDYGDGEFDLVFSEQTLEHIYPRHHRKVVAELCRISSDFVVLEFPVGGDDDHPDLTMIPERSHVGVKSVSYWVRLFHMEKFFFDLRSSKMLSTDSAVMTFKRESLGEVWM